MTARMVSILQLTIESGVLLYRVRNRPREGTAPLFRRPGPDHSPSAPCFALLNLGMGRPRVRICLVNRDLTFLLGPDCGFRRSSVQCCRLGKGPDAVQAVGGSSPPARGRPKTQLGHDEWSSVLDGEYSRRGR